MRPPPLGSTATLRVRVGVEHRAAFDDEVVHDVYGTAAVVRHAEQVSRRLFRPCLQEGEEGVGASLSLRHVHPVPVGHEVVLTATVTEATPRKLVTEVEVRSGEVLAATVSFTQVVIDHEAWQASLGG